MFFAGPRWLLYSSSVPCSQTGGNPRMIGCSGARVTTSNSCASTHSPAWPGRWSSTSLPSRYFTNGPARSSRPPHPPMPIISLNAGQSVNVWFTAWP